MDQHEMPKEIKDTISSIQKMREKVKDTAKEHPDVKSGKVTVEEQLKEPGYLLYEQIMNSVIDTLSGPQAAACFVKIGEKLGPEFTQNFVAVIGLCMASSAHNAIVFYDELLKKELQAKFSEVSAHVNTCETDVATFGGVMKVFKKRLDELEKDKKIKEVMNDAK